MGRFLFDDDFDDNLIKPYSARDASACLEWYNKQNEIEQESADDFAEYVRITRGIAAIIKRYRRPEQRRAVAWISNHLFTSMCAQMV